MVIRDESCVKGSMPCNNLGALPTHLCLERGLRVVAPCCTIHSLGEPGASTVFTSLTAVARRGCVSSPTGSVLFCLGLLLQRLTTNYPRSYTRRPISNVAEGKRVAVKGTTWPIQHISIGAHEFNELEQTRSAIRHLNI